MLCAVVRQGLSFRTPVCTAYRKARVTQAKPMKRDVFDFEGSIIQTQGSS